MSGVVNSGEGKLPAKALAARLWARRVLAQGEAVVLDIETTGLGPLDEPIEIAVLGLDGACRFHALVRPSRPISEEAVLVHGLREPDLLAASDFAGVCGAVKSAITARTILSYNAAFDRSMLWRAFERVGQPAPRCRWQCVCDRFEEWAGVRTSLARAALAMGVEAVDPHRALGDSETTRRVVLAMAGVFTTTE